MPSPEFARTDLICAIASPAGGAERGIVRLSGDAVAKLLSQVLRADGSADECVLERERQVLHGRFLDGHGELPVTVFWMPAPNSYTGEDVAELHLPGAVPLLEVVITRLIELGARAAQPGEFTRRAFENGRLDLSQAEGVLALTRAENDAQRRAALALLEGGLRSRCEGIRNTLEELRGLCEASLDFDEADTGHVPTQELAQLGSEALMAVTEALGWELRRDRARGLPKVALVGLPNAGKSSLFNVLTQSGTLKDHSDARLGSPNIGFSSEAIVSDVAGTTRDTLRAFWNMGNTGNMGSVEDTSEGSVELLDLPGLEAGDNEVERAAQRLAVGQRGAADLWLWVVDSNASEEHLSQAVDHWNAATQLVDSPPPGLLVWSQVDRASEGGRHAAVSEPTAWLQGNRLGHLAWRAVSAQTGAGLTELEAEVRRLLGLQATPENSRQGSTSTSAGASTGTVTSAGLGRETAARHTAALQAAESALQGALAGLQSAELLDQVADHLREATDALDDLTGHTAPEDLLDRIFSRFCLGK